MSQKQYIIIGASLILIVFLFFTLRKNALERFLDQGIEAVETEQVDTLLSLLSSHYIKAHGLSPELIRSNLVHLFQSFDKISVQVSKVTTRLDSDTHGILSFRFRVVANMSSSARLAGGKVSNPYGAQRMYLVGSPTHTGEMVLQMVKEKGDWKLLSIERIDIGMSIPGTRENSGSSR